MNDMNGRTASVLRGLTCSRVAPSNADSEAADQSQSKLRAAAQAAGHSHHILLSRRHTERMLNSTRMIVLAAAKNYMQSAAPCS